MIKALTLSVFTTILTALPVFAAGEILVSYGPWKGSIRVESLETFAKDGTVNSNLRFYMRSLNREQREQFRQALVKQVNVSPVLLSRFFNSALGADILARAGRGITIQGGSNGKFALRSAIIKAAFEPEGLTLLNVLRNFPTNMQLQGEYLIGLSNTVDLIVEATNYFTAQMGEIATQQAESSTVDFSKLPELRNKGSFQVRQETLTLTDASRKRTFYMILITPETYRSGKTPVVIISHGLASRPEDFADLGKHLASYGFVVALPQHPGSDFQQKLNLLNGLSREVFEKSEFYDRPKDISFVIDELERRNQAKFGGRLDLENVGVVGHSFGGYGALAVAGAEINLDYLKSVCDQPFSGLNVSLLLQCRALDVSFPTYQFRDPRVKAVIGKNPVNSTIFGQSGLAQIQIPVMITGGNYDPATPFVLEQVRAFTWLTTPDKYLALAEGQAHVDFSQLDAGITQVLDSMPGLILPDADLLNSYRDPIVVAFFEVYLAKNEQFKPFLTSAYGKYLSQDQKFRFLLIDASAQPILQESLSTFQRRR
ncbi:dienelactone hydrolase [Aphanothece hegewaldii CCALA 016]|uniref:Dienelactone hydrolase n=1 Tax=Aphanothece hegewaldii CCALA 016 TaxID=2107694 RepID=A0A2T1M362_9CHRO|nr:alpha/beta hydrolase [Aphanothece hegewaldii]PSF39265.1 dienelactone hydrolase [Aphanothece hegewaldii CCALA 016]